MEEVSGDLTRSSAVTMALVPPGQVAAWWPGVVDFIEAAMAHSLQHELTMPELLASLARDERWLMLAFGHAEGGAVLVGALVLQLGNAPSGQRSLVILTAGGVGVEAWVGQATRACVEMARAGGLVELQAVGRPGWAKVLKPYGVEHRASIYTIKVEG